MQPQDVHKSLCDYIGARSDIGVFKGLLQCVLNPRNPFDADAPQTPSTWFVLFSLLAASFLACFAYFNFF